MANENTLQHALGPFLVAAQFFGVLPVAGVWPSNAVSNVKFRWCSLALLVSLFLICFTIFDCVVSTKAVMELGLKIYTIGSLSFSVICFFSFTCFLLLSYRWPHIIQETSRCEFIFLKPNYASSSARSFSARLRLWCVLLLCAAAVEHSSYMGSAIYNNYLQIKECNLTVNFWEHYFQRERQQIFSILSYRVWYIPLIEWTTISMTFAWSFVDVFLTLICRGMEVRYQQLHWRIMQHADKHMPHDFWHEVRCDLLNLTDLLKLYDQELSSLVLLSCAHNMYYLCVQIYHSFQDKGHFMDELYFWCSLIYVTLRLLIMMFSAASINETVKCISCTLYEIQTDFWCLELKRLIDIVNTDIFALSGKGFFFLTRRLIFGMAGTLLVYELVLINQLGGTVEKKSFCGSGVAKSIFS